ncbi:DUF3800 domain-containing protein [Salsuginibacillus kocurii]|uniref:DUF3800 domain-containing protein n=1 Tax=Salsuginibacillus kocurii TaxID=427078 RepID=UPI00035EEF01|nr:DUF3800 domain-containing protein [Salsuginibacillus kocurii]
MTSYMDVNVFFDESGKNNDKPHLMGGMAMPAHVYKQPDFFDELSLIIRENEIHWTNFGGHHATSDRIKHLIYRAMKYSPVLTMNVISYDQSIIKENSHPFSNVHTDLSEQTIYTKFPERIVYGLLRKRGKDAFANGSIIVEDATEYRKLKLSSKMKNQLNMQSLYRGERFKVSESTYASKGTEPGLEITDLVLGMMRTIITNPLNPSNREKKKIELLMEFLNDDRFLNFLKSIRYFEWNNSNELSEIDFYNYIQSFITQNHAYYNFL